MPFQIFIAESERQLLIHIRRQENAGKITLKEYNRQVYEFFLNREGDILRVFGIPDKFTIEECDWNFVIWSDKEVAENDCNTHLRHLYYSKKQERAMRGYCIAETIDGKEIKYTECCDKKINHAEIFKDSTYLGIGKWKETVKEKNNDG